MGCKISNLDFESWLANELLHNAERTKGPAFLLLQWWKSGPALCGYIFTFSFSVKCVCLYRRVVVIARGHICVTWFEGFKYSKHNVHNAY
jgi:hypothetical protein